MPDRFVFARWKKITIKMHHANKNLLNKGKSTLKFHHFDAVNGTLFIN